MGSELIVPGLSHCSKVQVDSLIVLQPFKFHLCGVFSLLFVEGTEQIKTRVAAIFT